MSVATVSAYGETGLVAIGEKAPNVPQRPLTSGADARSKTLAAIPERVSVPLVKFTFTVELAVAPLR